MRILGHNRHTAKESCSVVGAALPGSPQVPGKASGHLCGGIRLYELRLL